MSFVFDARRGLIVVRAELWGPSGSGIMRGMFNLLLPAGTPQLYAAPASAPLGQTVTVTIQAQFMNFVSGSTQVSAGAGITVSNVVVINPTTLTAQLTVAGNAALGPRSIISTTPSQEETLVNGFTVTAPQ